MRRISTDRSIRENPSHPCSSVFYFWATYSAPRRVQRHALIIAHEPRRFQQFAALRRRHRLAVPLLHRQLVPSPPDRDRHRGCPADTPPPPPHLRGWRWAAPSVACPAPSTSSTGRPARSISQLPARRSSGRVPPSSNGTSNGAPQPYRFAGSRLCSSTTGAVAVEGRCKSCSSCHRFRQGELRPRQPLHEVAAPHLAAQLHAAQHLVQHAPRQHPRIEQRQFAGHDAVTVSTAAPPARRRAASGFGPAPRQQRPAAFRTSPAVRRSEGGAEPPRAMALRPARLAGLRSASPLRITSK